MSERKSGVFSETSEYTITTCDQCGADLEQITKSLLFVDKLPRYALNTTSFSVTDWDGTIETEVEFCSVACLLRFVTLMQKAGKDKIPT